MKESVEKFIDNHIEIIRDRGILIYPEDIKQVKEFIEVKIEAEHLGKRGIIKELNEYFGCESYGMSHLDYEMTGKDNFQFIENKESFDFNEDDEHLME